MIVLEIFVPGIFPRDFDLRSFDLGTLNRLKMSQKVKLKLKCLSIFMGEFYWMLCSLCVCAARVSLNSINVGSKF